MGWTFLPHSAYRQDLPPSDYHLFGTITDALRGRHFADDSELKQSFRDCSEVEAGNFALVHSVLLNVGKRTLKMTETLWKK
jgi:hypothetical protein